MGSPIMMSDGGRSSVRILLSVLFFERSKTTKGGLKKRSENGKKKKNEMEDKTEEKAVSYVES